MPDNTRAAAKPLTAIEAVAKITKILNQLTPLDRKRVLAFVNDAEHTAASGAG